jgi:hypothetical protein
MYKKLASLLMLITLIISSCSARENTYRIVFTDGTETTVTYSICRPSNQTDNAIICHNDSSENVSADAVFNNVLRFIKE